MKLKKKHWSLILLGVTLFILIIMVILVLALKLNWWFFFGFLIFFSLGWTIYGIIELVSLGKKDPKIENIELEDAVKLAKEYSLHHPDNPDNLLIKQHYTIKVGESGAEKTPILVIEAKGTELSEDRYFIINKEDKSEFDMLVNPSQEDLNNKIIQIAKSQPRPVVTEQIPGTDQFGRPTTRYVTKTTSTAEIKKEEEVKKAEEESAL